MRTLMVSVPFGLLLPFMGSGEFSESLTMAPEESMESELVTLPSVSGITLSYARIPRTPRTKRYASTAQYVLKHLLWRQVNTQKSRVFKRPRIERHARYG